MKISKFGWLAAVLAVAAVVGAVAYTPRPASAVIASATKTCTAVLMGGVATGSNTCTLTVTPMGGFVGTSTVTLAPGTGTATFSTTTPPTATCVGGTVAIAAVTANSFQFTPMGCVANPVVITETLTATVSGTVTQTALEAFTGTSASATATIQAPAGGVGPFVTTIALAPGCPVTITVAPNATQTFTCFLDIDDNSITPDLVSSGIVSVTVGITTPGAAIVGFQLQSVTTSVSGVVSGSTGNVRCGDFNTADTCDEVAVVVTVRGVGPGVALPNTATISVTANYVPDNPMLNLPANLTSTTLATVITQAASVGFTQGGIFQIRCATPAVLVDVGVTPGQIGANNVSAVGILPAALSCTAAFWESLTSTTIVAVAPGTIEISTLTGTLLDLRGAVTTNLRIGCGLGTVIDDATATINPNTCLGVRFGVIGLGVGLVEIRARYEPSSAAAAAGIQERETATTVAFVAPATSLNLLLNPNPVGVGATGVATLRFNRVSVVNQELLINPSTGLPIAVSLGTVLNGTVTFTSSNPAVASFTGGLQTGTVEVTNTVTGTSSTGVIVGTGQTISIRCGTVLTTVADVTVASFNTFFGGCAEVAANYRGNAVGTTTITATFLPDLPNTFGGGAFVSNIGALQNIVAGSTTQNTISRVLEVVTLAAATQRLVPGCNNVVAPANETVQQVAARVDPASAVISIWKQVPGTTTFQGAAISGNVPAAVSNLTNVLALDAIFICVNAAATYRIS